MTEQIKDSVERALAITSKFEGQKGYSNVAGNFDGMGLSFGLFQWNAGHGTLQPIIRNCIKNMPATTKECFGDGYDTLVAILATDAKFFQWTKSINDRNNRIIEPWYTRFYKLGLTEGCQKFQQQASIGYLKNAKRIFDNYGFTTDRAYCLAFDIAIQNGSVTPSAASLYKQRLTAAGANGKSELNRLMILANAIADTSRNLVLNTRNGKPWTIRDDVRSRKLTIVSGQGTVHGKRWDLEKTFGLSDKPAQLEGHKL